jgi:hypothetical protein
VRGPRFTLVLSTVAVIAAMTVALSAQDPASSHFSVMTWQVDSHRTGRNLNEGTLISPLTNFHQICNVQLDGQVYAQPLVVTSGSLNSGMFYIFGISGQCAQ